MANDTASTPSWGTRPPQDLGPSWPAAGPDARPAPPAGPWPAPAGPPPLWQPYPAVARQGTNGLAIASLVLGIVWLYWLGSLLAVIFGHTALAQIKRSHGSQGGRGLAIAGVVLGWIGIAFLALGLVALATDAGST
jgi:hypothetical protein